MIEPSGRTAHHIGRHSGLLLLALLLAACQGVLEVRIERESPTGVLPLGKVAYILDGNVWVKNLASNQQERLTQDGDNSFPMWSADGRWIAHLKGQQLWTIEVSTGQSVQVGAFPVFTLAWSSQGGLLGYLSPSAGLGVWDADARAARTLAPAESVLASGRHQLGPEVVNGSRTTTGER